MNEQKREQELSIHPFSLWKWMDGHNREYQREIREIKEIREIREIKEIRGGKEFKEISESVSIKHEPP